MTHHIYELRFGNATSEEYGTNSLGGFNSEKEIEEVFMGITYTYFPLHQCDLVMPTANITVSRRPS